VNDRVPDSSPALREGPAHLPAIQDCTIRAFSAARGDSPVVGASLRRTSHRLDGVDQWRRKNKPRQPTHRASSVIRREGRDDYWLNIGRVFPHGSRIRVSHLLEQEQKMNMLEVVSSS
jgi:hypothetical protein